MPAKLYIDFLTDAVLEMGEHGIIRSMGQAIEEEDGIGQDNGEVSSDTLFFPGCSFLNFAPDLLDKTYGALRSVIPGCGISFLCCGKILEYEPGADEVKNYHERRLAQTLDEKGVHRVIVACPNCARELRLALEREAPSAKVEIVPLPQVLKEEGFTLTQQDLEAFFDRENPLIFFHDSCPDREQGAFAASVRTLFPEGSIRESENTAAQSLCCGSLLRAMGRFEAANAMAEKREQQALEVGADVLVCSCMSCVRQLVSVSPGVTVCHYLEPLLSASVNWPDLATHMQERFLFEDYRGTRDFCGISCEETGGGEAVYHD